MNKDEVARSYFAGGLLAYMEAYYLDSWLSSHGIIDNRPQITYNIPNESYISEHWREIRSEIQMLGDICNYSDELKEVAKQYLPLFLQGYPEYKGEKCLCID